MYVLEKMMDYVTTINVSLYLRSDDLIDHLVSNGSRLTSAIS